MERRALIWQIFPVSLLVIVVSLVAVIGFSATALRSFYLDRVSDDLRSRAALLQEQVHPFLRARDDSTLQQLCENLGDTSATRITVISISGEVVADSEEHPETMDNHAERPEILEAIQGKTGTSIRFSDTLNQQMMYVAVPVIDVHETLGVLRVALPITSIDGALSSILSEIVYGTLVVALLAAVASWFVSRRITRPLGILQSGAERYAHGELGHQLSIHHSQEIDALANAMNKMAQDLDDKMKTVIQQKHEQQAVLSSMVEGVLAVDSNGTLISINETAASLFEVDITNAIGRNVHEIIRNSAFHAFLEETVKSSLPIEDEITFHIDDERTYIVHGKLLQRLQDDSAGALIVLHDVTHIRKLERMRTDFVSNVSHELRTPVTSIKGFVETLLNNPPSDKEEYSHFLKIIDKNASQLSALIEDLLNLSRMEQSDESTEDALEETRINEIVVQAQTSCLPASNKRHVAIEIKCDPDLSTRIHASLLQQAVSNLIDNAVKYSDDNQTVSVDVTSDNSELRIQVRDSGTGIDPKHLPRLFERFYRIDKARSRELGGTGLGLAIVKHIAELHGGRVAVESEIGVGSTFTISLPQSGK